MNNLPKTVTRKRRDCDLNPGARSASESSTLTTRLPSHPLESAKYLQTMEDRCSNKYVTFSSIRRNVSLFFTSVLYDEVDDMLLISSLQGFQKLVTLVY